MSQQPAKSGVVLIPKDGHRLEDKKTNFSIFLRILFLLENPLFIWEVSVPVRLRNYFNRRG
jgi:hypothetical protein